nr:hypothetical protein [uncultured Devosia sp.]
MSFALALTLLFLSGLHQPLAPPNGLFGETARGGDVVHVAQAGASTTLPARADPGSLADPSVGLGISSVFDYSPQLPFIDIMKSARPWTANVRGEWGSMSFQELKDGGYLDEQGWPTAMPAGIATITTLVLTDLPAESASANGRYRLRYEGQGLVEISSAGETVMGRSGEAWFNTKVGPESMVIINILRTDPNGVGEYLRNFTIVKEENIPAFEAGQIFNPLWIERINDMREIRFMDWMSVNNSTDSEWAERPLANDFTYGNHGVPLEIMIRLANEIGADPWFTIPHLATDDYIRNFATTVRDALAPDLKAHVEFSNEVWNWMFSQADWANRNAVARWGEGSSWVQYYGLRASQMAEIWDEVYGDAAEDRVIKIISTHTAWHGLEQDILTAPLWTAEAPENRPPYSYFDAYAITGYFSGSLGSDLKAPAIIAWLAESRAQAEREAEAVPEEQRADYIAAHGYDLALERAEQELRDGSLTGTDEDSVNTLLTDTFPYHAAVARKYGLDLIMYEGGPSVSNGGPWAENEELTAFLIAFSYSEHMGRLYTEVMTGWKDAGGTLFNAFGDVFLVGSGGSFSLQRYLEDENPRLDAVHTFNSAHQAWWETRPPGTFN